MSTTYTDSSPVVVSPEPRRSSCSCVAVGCGCLLVLLIALGILVAVMWGPAKEFFSKAMDQMAAEAARDADRELRRDPRIVRQLGEPLQVNRDESVQFTLKSPRLRFQLTGPNGSATVDAVYDVGAQEFRRMEVTFSDGSKVDLTDDPGEDQGGDAGQAVPAAADNSGALGRLDEPLQQVVQLATNDARVKDRLGDPVRFELIRGVVEPSRWEWEFAVSGPNGRAEGKASAESDGQAWTINRLEITFEGNERLNLLEGPSAP